MGDACCLPKKKPLFPYQSDPKQGLHSESCKLTWSNQTAECGIAAGCSFPSGPGARRCAIEVKPGGLFRIARFPFPAHCAACMNTR